MLPRHPVRWVNAYHRIPVSARAQDVNATEDVKEASKTVGIPSRPCNCEVLRPVTCPVSNCRCRWKKKLRPWPPRRIPRVLCHAKAHAKIDESK